MNKKTVTFSAALSGLMFLTSCVKEVMNEQPVELTSRLSVITRAADDDNPVIATPIRVYVIGSDGKCAAVQDIDGDDALAPLSLPEGTYDVYALGGVDDTRYVLPSQKDARRDTEIRLQEGKVLDDLMAATAHVSLADGEDEQLTLGMDRKVVLLKGITINEVPEDVTKVGISLQPLYESILLNGTLSGSEGKYTANLQVQTDGTTWKSPSNVYLFPPTQKPTISVSFEREDGSKKSYSYTCKEELTANYKLTIEGTYRTDVGVRIGGTLTGTAWDGEKTITLTFDENLGNVTGQEDSKDNENTANNQGGNGNSNAPDNSGGSSTSTLKVGDLYKDCYVLAVNGKDVTLLSSKEKDKITLPSDDSETALSKINIELSSWSIEGISATWSLPDEATISQYLLKNANDKNYFCTLNNTLGTIRVFNGQVYTKTTSLGSGNYLRPITTITIE